MDEQAPVVEVRRRQSRAEAEQVVGDYEASGLSRVEFCRRQGLSLATLARYRKRAQGKVVPANRWLAVEMANSTLESQGRVVWRWHCRMTAASKSGAGLTPTLWCSCWACWSGSVFGWGPATRIYLAAGATDMGKGFEGLYGLVRDRLL